MREALNQFFLVRGDRVKGLADRQLGSYHSRHMVRKLEISSRLLYDPLLMTRTWHHEQRFAARRPSGEPAQCSWGFPRLGWLHGQLGGEPDQWGTKAAPYGGTGK